MVYFFPLNSIWCTVTKKKYLNVPTHTYFFCYKMLFSWISTFCYFMSKKSYPIFKVNSFYEMDKTFCKYSINFFTFFRECQLYHNRMPSTTLIFNNSTICYNDIYIIYFLINCPVFFGLPSWCQSKHECSKITGKTFVPILRGNLQSSKCL